MTSDRTRGLIAAVAVALVGSLALLGACTDGQDSPAGPEQAPDFYHSGDLSDGEADAIKALSGNISGNGSEVCNSDTVHDSDIVGENEEEWFGEKIDPAEDKKNNGFSFTLKDEGETLDWTETEGGTNLMQAVAVKAGDSTVVYYYNEGDPDSEPDPTGDDEDSGLDADDKEISHYTYCFVKSAAVVKGVKFDDADADGKIDDGEDRLADWEIRAYADVGDDAEKFDSDDELVATETTGAEGEYEFKLAAGDYVICEVQQDGWNQSLPSNASDACAGVSSAEDGYVLSLSSGEVADGKDFGNNQTTIEVTVEDAAQVPVKGQTVIAVDDQHGPYADPTDASSLQEDVTNTQGLAVIDGLDDGEYCVHASPVRTPSGKVMPSSEDPALGENLGTAVTGDPKGNGVELTVTNFDGECLGGNASIRPGDKLTLTLVAGNAVEGTFKTLDGDDGEISAWVVADVSSLVPWSLPTGDVDPASVKPGLFVSAAKDNGKPRFATDVPEGEVAFESDKVPGPSSSIQTASFRTSETGDLGSIATEPLRCKTNSVKEELGDGDDVDFKGPYNPGFLAEDADLTGPIADEFAISYAQTAGDATLKLRARTKNTKRLVAEYTCSESGCEITKEKGPLAKDLEVKIFGDAIGGKGSDRVSWIITGLPDDPDLVVQSGLSTSGDKVPDAARDDDDDGLVDSPLPDSCETEGSTWILGAD